MSKRKMIGEEAKKELKYREIEQKILKKIRFRKR